LGGQIPPTALFRAATSLKSPRPSGTPLQKGGKTVPLFKGELKGDYKRSKGDDIFLL